MDRTELGVALRAAARRVDGGAIDLAADPRSEDVPRMVPGRHPRDRRGRG